MQDQGCRLFFNPIPYNDKGNFLRQLGEVKLIMQQFLLSCRWHLKTHHSNGTGQVWPACCPAPPACAAQRTEPRHCPAGRARTGDFQPPTTLTGSCQKAPAPHLQLGAAPSSAHTHPTRVWYHPLQRQAFIRQPATGDARLHCRTCYVECPALQEN